MRSKFHIGDMIMPKEPLKQVVGVILQVIQKEEHEQDLEVIFQNTQEIVWISSLDVKLLKYKKISSTHEEGK